MGLSFFGILAASNGRMTQALQFSCSDRVTPLVAATNVMSWPVPFNVTVTEVQAYVVTQNTSGNKVTVDINKNGTTILSTKLTIDNNEQNSVTASVPAVISTASFTKGDEISIDIDDAGGAAIASGLIVTLIF